MLQHALAVYMRNQTDKANFMTLENKDAIIAVTIRLQGGFL